MEKVLLFWLKGEVYQRIQKIEGNWNILFGLQFNNLNNWNPNILRIFAFIYIRIKNIYL